MSLAQNHVTNLFISSYRGATGYCHQMSNLGNSLIEVDRDFSGVKMSLPFDHVTLTNLYISNYRGHRSYIYPLKRLGCHQPFVSIQQILQERQMILC